VEGSLTPETRYARSGQLSIAYQVVGDGPIDVVLVPGFVSHLEIGWELPAWRSQWEALSAFARLIVFDKRGTGLSDRTDRLPSLEERMDDVRAVMDAAGSARAALIGISEGGPMALMFAATYPERTAALVLWASFARSTQAPDYPIGADPEVARTTPPWIEENWGQGGVVNAIAFQDVKADDRARRLFGRFERNSATPATAAAAMQFGIESDVRDVLPAVSAPTLVVHRTGDPLISVECGRYLAEHIAGARLVELPGAFHLSGTGADAAVLDEIEEFLTGSRHDRVVDRVLKTIVFTDIVGSTERAAELGDRRWRELLDAHDAVVQQACDQHRGEIVKTTGDGVFAAFDGPARAIRCAQTISRNSSPLGLTVRAGLHSGECEVRGDDLAGLTVHIGARVAALAEANEVLVTSTVRDLVIGSGFEFADRGSHVLRGVPGEWQVLALKA
jgi:pimeloyl-ACP methyl ester carboxylesterase